MMSMMSNFFSIRKDSKEIFEGLKITEHKEFCEKWMNKYPVLSVSFKDVEAETFEGAYKMLKTRLADVCKEFHKNYHADDARCLWWNFLLSKAG